jgi:hypothetical protein
MNFPLEMMPPRLKRAGDFPVLSETDSVLLETPGLCAVFSERGLHWKLIKVRLEVLLPNDINYGYIICNYILMKLALFHATSIHCALPLLCRIILFSPVASFIVRSLFLPSLSLLLFFLLFVLFLSFKCHLDLRHDI